MIIDILLAVSVVASFVGACFNIFSVKAGTKKRVLNISVVFYAISFILSLLAFFLYDN